MWYTTKNSASTKALLVLLLLLASASAASAAAHDERDERAGAGNRRLAFAASQSGLRDPRTVQLKVARRVVTTAGIAGPPAAARAAFGGDPAAEAAAGGLRRFAGSVDAGTSTQRRHRQQHQNVDDAEMTGGNDDEGDGGYHPRIAHLSPENASGGITCEYEDCPGRQGGYENFENEMGAYREPPSDEDLPPMPDYGETCVEGRAWHSLNRPNCNAFHESVDAGSMGVSRGGAAVDGESRITFLAQGSKRDTWEVDRMLVPEVSIL